MLVKTNYTFDLGFGILQPTANLNMSGLGMLAISAGTMEFTSDAVYFSDEKQTATLAIFKVANCQTNRSFLGLDFFPK